MSKPTKTQIHLTLEAKQVVNLAVGHSDVHDVVWVRNYKRGRNPMQFPKFGQWKTFDEIKKSLKQEIEKRFPKAAFPFMRPEGKITLYRRNEEDKEYLWDMGDFDAE